MNGYSRRARIALVLSTLVLLSGGLQAQENPTVPQPTSPDQHGTLPTIPTITFSLERPGLAVPSYTIRIMGFSGTYAGMQVPQPAREYAAASAPQKFERSFTISLATADKIAALAHSLKNFNTECASNAKNIADTGKKTLTYLGPVGDLPAQGSCIYNYSENKSVDQLTTIFQGIAETLDEGRELDRLHRYDRLGLDEALATLAQEVADGHALEVGAIQDTLRSIAADTEVMQRAQKRANALLARIPR